MSQKNPFLGVWILDPNSCQYSMGEPPKSGRYEIREDGDKLIFTMGWVDAEDKPLEMSFAVLVDGEEHPFENPALADSTKYRYQSERILESWSYKDGRELGYSRRELNEAGTIMLVVQQVSDPNGGSLQNLATYHLGTA
ncbi:MAG: hypothetical protein RRB13_04290 [bacterium]|nr:hypothetical protein [bacterium]